MATREVSLPRCLWVSSYEFALQMVEPENSYLEGNNGMTYAEDGDTRIWISSGLGPRKTLEIVFHEVTHAINFAYDIDPTDDISEEDIASKHGIAWSALYMDNPRFQRWVTSVTNRIRKERKDA